MCNCSSTNKEDLQLFDSAAAVFLQTPARLSRFSELKFHMAY